MEQEKNGANKRLTKSLTCMIDSSATVADQKSVCLSVRQWRAKHQRISRSGSSSSSSGSSRSEFSKLIMIITAAVRIPLRILSHPSLGTVELLINGAPSTPSGATARPSAATPPYKNLFPIQQRYIQWINENEGLLVFSFCLLLKWVCVRKSVRRTKRSVRLRPPTQPPDAGADRPVPTPTTLILYTSVYFFLFFVISPAQRFYSSRMAFL